MIRSQRLVVGHGPAAGEPLQAGTDIGLAT